VVAARQAESAGASEADVTAAAAAAADAAAPPTPVADDLDDDLDGDTQVQEAPVRQFPPALSKAPLSIPGPQAPEVPVFIKDYRGPTGGRFPCLDALLASGLTKVTDVLAQGDLTELPGILHDDVDVIRKAAGWK